MNKKAEENESTLTSDRETAKKKLKMNWKKRTSCFSRQEIDCCEWENQKAAERTQHTKQKSAKQTNRKGKLTPDKNKAYRST